MSEAEAVNLAPAPRTRESLANDLRALGVAEGMAVLVHSSLSALGWVCGGPVAVVQALIDVVTPAGTIVMPAFSGEYSDPARWQDPPVPRAWWPVIRESMPAFDHRVTPTRWMGRVAEVFRTWPGVLRSYHPQVSFAAWGLHAERVTAGHQLAYSLGQRRMSASLLSRKLTGKNSVQPHEFGSAAGMIFLLCLVVFCPRASGKIITHVPLGGPQAYPKNAARMFEHMHPGG